MSMTRRGLPTLTAAAESPVVISPADEGLARSGTELLHELHLQRIELERQIEALRSAQTVLEESRDRYAALYDFAPVGYLTLTVEGLIEQINLTAVTVLGREQKELLQRRFAELVIPHDRDRWHLYFLGELNSDDRQSCELMLRRGDGSPVDVRLDAVRVLQNGQAQALRITLTVITERKKAELALLESEERWKFALEGAGDGLWDWNIQTGIAFYSHRYKEMLGYADDEIGNTSDEWVKRIHPDDAPGVFAELQPYLKGKPGSATVEFRMLCKDGSWRWTLGRGMVVSRDADGQPLRMIGTNADISERKRAEAELIAAKTAAESANRTKSHFLAAASHDLRQPMQAIGLFTDALGRTNLTSEQKRLSDYLAQSAQSLSGLLDALLDISRLDAGTVKRSHELIQAETLMQKLDADYSSSAAEKSLGFKLSFPVGQMALVTDGKLLLSLLGNLIGNAIKYTAQGGILVAIRRRGKQALIQVWDTGIGIARKDQKAIYEEYFQVANPERDRTKGLGLGLAIVKRVARLLDTEVICRSRPGRGSVFEFRLPLADPAANKMPGPITPVDLVPAAQAPLQGRQIVVVEDDVLVAKAIQFSLESLGARVIGYLNAEQALTDSACDAADFYISDFRLPGRNGVEFLDTVQQRSTRPIKAVLLTGDTAVSGIEMGSSSWPVLVKPVELPDLLNAIEYQNSN